MHPAIIHIRSFLRSPRAFVLSCAECESVPPMAIEVVAQDNGGHRHTEGGGSLHAGEMGVVSARISRGNCLRCSIKIEETMRRGDVQGGTYRHFPVDHSATQLLIGILVHASRVPNACSLL